MTRLAVVTELVLIFITPVVWFALGWAPDSIHLVVLQVFILLLIVLAHRHGWSRRQLGFRRDTFLPAVRLLWPGTAVMLIAVFVLYRMGFGAYFFERWWVNPFFLYYFTIGALTQQFAFQGYLRLLLRRLTTSSTLQIVLNAFLFSFLHLLHRDWALAASTFAFDAYLTWATLRQPNLWALTIVHAIVGGAAIILGFV